MLNYKEIESLKLALSNLVMHGCKLQIPAYGVDGKVVGVGYRPYWTNPGDSKIDRLEFNVMDQYGMIKPFHFSYVTGFDVVAREGDRIENLKKVSLDLYLYSPEKDRKQEKEPYDKVRIHIAGT